MSAFAPPPVSSHQGAEAGFTPPPVSSHQGKEEQPSTVSRAAKAILEGTGKPLWDIIQGARNPADYEAHQKAIDALKGVVHGALNEPGRVTNEFFNKAGNAFLRGDISGGIRHVMGATPIF